MKCISERNFIHEGDGGKGLARNCATVTISETTLEK